jgi:hypothetical protein
MSATTSTPAATTAIQIPEWDSNAVHTSKGGVATTSQTAIDHSSSNKTNLQNKFNAILPQSRTYFRLKRRAFLIAVSCLLLALLAFIIGLSVGLKKHSKGCVSLVNPIKHFPSKLINLPEIKIYHFQQTVSNTKATSHTMAPDLALVESPLQIMT